MHSEKGAATLLFSWGNLWLSQPLSRHYHQPALKGEVAASVTSRRRGCIGTALVCVNPSVTACAVPAPRPGRLLDCATPLQSCPRLRGKWHEVPKGEWLKEAKLSYYSPSASLTLSSSPINGGAFWCSTNSAYSAVPLRGAIVSMGLRGVQGGLRGEIEIFPGPPAKKIIKTKKSPLRGSFPSLAYLFYLHPKPLLLELVPGTNRPTPGT